MQLLTISAVVALLVADQAPLSWNLANCRHSLTDEKTSEGHACTPEHLQADTAEILGGKIGAATDDPLALARERVSHDWAERGLLEHFLNDLVAKAKLAAEAMQVSRKDTVQAVRDYWGTIAHFSTDLPGTELLAALRIGTDFAQTHGIADIMVTVPEAAPEIAMGGESVRTQTRGLPEPSLPQQGAALLRQCEQFGQASVEGSLCSAYIAGVADTLEDYRILACRPEAVTYGQLITIVLKFLHDHPERLHENRRALVDEALRASFPCTHSSPSP